MDDTCVDNCYAMDPASAMCSQCTDDAVTACINSACCQMQYDALMCCVDTCADPDADACYTVTCATQSNEYDGCSTSKGASCNSDACFKTM